MDRKGDLGGVVVTVDTPLALYTTLFGWQFYNTIWDALVGSGIAFFPFLGLLISNFIETRTEGDLTESQPRVAVTRVETQLVLMMLVIALAAQPASITSLSPDTVRWIPPPSILNELEGLETVDANDAANQHTFGENGFSEFAELDSVPVPAWWYAVQAISQGLNRAIINEFPTAQGIRDIDQLARLLTISDPALRAETSDFYTQCYVPARSRFDAERPDIGDTPPEDTQWLGSRYFTENYYDDIRAGQSVNGFEFDATRDTEWSAATAPENGKPFCNDWWLGDTGPSLRERLLEQVDLSTAFLGGAGTGFLAVLAAATDGLLGGDDAADLAIRKLLTNSPPAFSNQDFREGRQDSAVGKFVKNGTTEFGTLGAAAFFDVATDVLLLGAPMVQPLLLLGIFALLPFAMVASSYSLRFMVIGAIAIFTINFWTVLWYIAGWIDDQLIKAMWPDVGVLEAFMTSDTFLGTSGLAKRAMLDMVTASMYFFLPTIFTALMVWAGINAAGGVTRLGGVLRGSAVSSAAGGAQKAARTGISGAKKLGGAAVTAGKSAAARG